MGWRKIKICLNFWDQDIGRWFLDEEMIVYLVRSRSRITREAGIIGSVQHYIFFVQVQLSTKLLTPIFSILM